MIYLSIYESAGNDFEWQNNIWKVCRNASACNEAMNLLRKRKKKGRGKVYFNNNNTKKERKRRRRHTHNIEVKTVTGTQVERLCRCKL